MTTPTTPARHSAALRITSARVATLRLRAVRRTLRRLVVQGRLSSRASGRVTVRFAARAGGRTRRVTARVRIARHAFHVAVSLPHIFTRARAGTVAVSYAGDADTRAATARAAIRWRG